VTWDSKDQQAGTYGVYAQRYDFDGNMVGSEIAVSSTATPSDDMFPTIACFDDGKWVVAYHSDH